MTIKKGFQIVCAVWLVALHSGADRPNRKTFNLPESIAYSTRSYVEGHGRATELGIAVQKKHMDRKEPLPTVVFIHGGGWRNGDKDQHVWECVEYASRGYVAITLSYRLMDEAPFPQCIEDVKTAIRFIKSLAVEYPIDADNIGVWGYSAGAHLALMVGLSHEDEWFRSDLYPDFDSSVKCAVAIATPTYFSHVTRRNSVMSEKQSKDPAFIERVSPLSYINKDQIPILMIHGTEDRIVPPHHYRTFKNSSLEKGVENFTLIEAEGGGHMFFFKERSYKKVVYDYFEANLKKGKKEQK
jgi:acetyl esterase/lipase